MHATKTLMLNALLAVTLVAALTAPFASACPPLDKKEQADGTVSADASDAAPVQAKELAETNVNRVASLSEIETDSSIEHFKRAAKVVALEEAIPSGSGLTIFVPTDEAFEGLNEATRRALRSERNRDGLRTILLHHVTQGRYSSGDLIGTTEIESLAGQSIVVDASFGGISVGRASVLESDLEIDGLIVHTIDAVLVPDDLKLLPDGDLLLGVYVQSIGRKSSEKLGLDVRRALFVSSLVDGANAGPAGVRKGDVIFAIDGGGASVASAERAKKEKGVGAHVTLSILRDGERLEIDVPVGIDPR